MRGSTLGVISARAHCCWSYFDGSRARFCHRKRSARCFWGLVLLLAGAETMGDCDGDSLVVGCNRNHERIEPFALVVVEMGLHSGRGDRSYPIVLGDPPRSSIAVAFASTSDCHLTPRWSGRVKDKVPSSNVGVRAAQLNR